MDNNKRIYYKLTHPQKRIWYVDKLNSNNSLHNIGGSLNINNRVEVDKLKETLNHLIETNEGLRIRFTQKDGQPVQYVYDFKKENIEFINFSNKQNPIEEFKKYLENTFKENFIIEDNQLYHFVICKISDKEYRLLSKFHHIIADGWSISLIEKQICETYNKLTKGKYQCFEENYSYIEYIKEENQYLNSDRFIRNKNFWNKKFKNIPEEFLYKSFNNLEGKRLSFNIDSDLSNKIRTFTADKKCSLNTFFTTIMLIYINKITNKNDLVIGTPVFNRTGSKQKLMIGMFTSTVPFRYTLDTETNISSLIKSINRELKYCLLNQKYPYDLLIKDLEINKKGYDSLFKISVNYYNAKYINNIEGIKFKAEEYYCGSQSYSLQLTIKEWEKDNITLNFDYKTKEYKEQEIKEMHKSIINIIKQTITNQNITVKNIKLLNEEEIKHKIYTLNQTSSYYPRKTIYELFEEQVLKTPNKTALEFKQEKVTYKQLNEKSNQLANYLRQKGIKRQNVVGIMESHSIELVISILAVLKAGGAYIPIDPSYPAERINYILEDASSFMLLTNFNTNDDIKFQGNTVNVNNVDLSLYDKENLTKINNITDLVYIIYTSGSTGKPKGVMIEHKGLTNYIWWADKKYIKDNDESMALYSSISFDLTVTSIFTPLISGNKILIYDNDDEEFVLYKILRENKTTFLKLTPSHLTLLKDTDNTKSNIKRLIVGGEDLKVNLANKIYSSFGKNIEIYNEYGPTETVVGCMIYKYNEEKDNNTSVPIGYPADNVQIYILDSELNPVPTGLVGELYISGDGVARGYLKNEYKTSERFIQNPYTNGKIMYKTGDTARYLENGCIEYVGRIDNQIKLRGHRIEIGEIEKYLLENQYVKDAVVAYKEDITGNKVLTAYVVRKKDVTDSELKNWLLKFLPKYMIPINYIFLKQLPLTVNGKIDYDLLPKPIPVEKEFIKYKTNIEKELVKAMKEILKVEKISMNDNYYQLGGDSIKAIQISSKLKNIGLNIKVKDILTYDSIKEIADAVVISKSNRDISQNKCEGKIKNTPIINWFLKQRFSNENTYNQYIFLELKNSLDIEKVKIAASKLLEHHDSLRINYNRKENNLYYNNNHLNDSNIVQYIDLTDCSSSSQDEKIKKFIKKAEVKFNIEKSLLFNITIFQLSHERQAVLFTAHHLVVDGVSWRIILNDFITILKQINNDKKIELPMKTHSLKEWSQQLQNYSKNNFEEEKAYWKDISNKNFVYPIDFNKEKDTVKTSSVLSADLSEDMTNILIKKVNEIYNIEINEVLIIALAITVSKTTNNEDIVIEVERHGRESINDYIDISRTVGWFTSIYPVYLKIEDTEIDSRIKSIKEQLRNIPNKGFNYSVIKYLNHNIKNSNNKHIRLNYLGDMDSIIRTNDLDIANIKFGLDNYEENSLTALMDIEAVIINKKLKINITYSNNRFKKETIKKFIESYIETLKLIINHCSNKSSKQFTPSDFDAVDISQEDLDSLFA